MLSALAVVIGARMAFRWLQMRKGAFGGLVVLITGGSRGLGLALALEFGRRGARVAICARDDDELAAACAQLRDAGIEVMSVRCDVAQRHEVEQVVTAVTEAYGRVDVLVNAAGIIIGGPMLAYALDDYEEVMAINFWGSVYTTLSVIPQMIERGSGRIVNITSIGAMVSVPHLLPYSCAKFALEGFSEGCAAELAAYGLHVTTVAPGLMRTGSYLNAYIKGQRQLEFALFSLIDSLPISSISVVTAARQIVDAAQRRAYHVVLSPQARVVALLHGLTPGGVTRMLALSNRFLPRARDAEDYQRRLGFESASSVSESALTMLNQQAARDYNQLNSRAMRHAQAQQGSQRIATTSIEEGRDEQVMPGADAQSPHSM